MPAAALVLVRSEPPLITIEVAAIVVPIVAPAALNITGKLIDEGIIVGIRDENLKDTDSVYDAILAPEISDSGRVLAPIRRNMGRIDQIQLPNIRISAFTNNQAIYTSIHQLNKSIFP